jgi:cysteine desulfurase
VIYFDYHATTPCDPQVIQVMLPYLFELFGNPSSSIHKVGQIAEIAVSKAREQTALLIDAQPNEIIFTSGATESNNLALIGLVKGNKTARRRILTTPIEHKSILEACKELQGQGYELGFLPVTSEGLVDFEQAKQLIDVNTLVVSIQAANNEIGSIQSVAKITQLAHENGAFVHSDAAQAVGKIPVSVNEWGIDLLSISSHKLYGPKGVGALFIRGGPYKIPIKPLVFGGGQESGIRPGTLNVSGIVGLGEASRLCQENLLNEHERLKNLRDKLEMILLTSMPSIKRNGALGQRLPNNSSLTFPGIETEALITRLPELAISTGSACTTGALDPSHVLLAIGLSRATAYQTLRIGLGRFTSENDIEQGAKMILSAAKELQDLMNS